MKFKERTLDEIAEMICGDEPADKHFVYRSSYYLRLKCECC